MKLYMAVSADKYELPWFVTSSRKEMADWYGVSVNYISQRIWDYNHGKIKNKYDTSGVRFCIVNVPDDEL